MPKSQGASNPVYLHKQSPTQLLWQKQLNLSCFVSTWFLLSLWLFACLWTIEAGEWQQIVGMHLNETNYYMLTAFTMADLKELSSFILAPRDSLFKEKLSLWLFVFLSFLPPCLLLLLLLLFAFHPTAINGSCKTCCSSFDDFGYFN